MPNSANGSAECPPLLGGLAVWITWPIAIVWLRIETWLSLPLEGSSKERIANEGPIKILQDDTFFNCENGRLKLRAFSKQEGEFIFYRRANQQGPKKSFYVRSPPSSPETLREALSRAYGQSGRVKKHRTLFMVGRTRVHLDQVRDLGHFLELEVVLQDGDSPAAGIEEAHRLIAQLGVEPSQLLDGAYVDLLSNGETMTGTARALLCPSAGLP